MDFGVWHHGEAVIGERPAVPAAHDQIAPPVVTFDEAGVDVADVEVYGVAPRAVWGIRPYHAVGASFTVDGEIDVVSAFVLLDVGSPDAPQVQRNSY